MLSKGNRSKSNKERIRFAFANATLFVEPGLALRVGSMKDLGASAWKNASFHVNNIIRKGPSRQL